MMQQAKIETKSLFKNADEIPQEVDCELKGNVPDWINGILLHNGPGKFQIGPDKFQHLFDGLALMHKWHVRDSKVSDHEFFHARNR